MLKSSRSHFVSTFFGESKCNWQFFFQTKRQRLTTLLIESRILISTFEMFLYVLTNVAVLNVKLSGTTNSNTI